MNRRILVILELTLALLLAGCKTSSGADPSELDLLRSPGSAEHPKNLSFLPQGLPSLTLPSDVGILSDTFPTTTEAAFGEAYLDGLFRGLSLTGVLGGDRVHPWPAASPTGKIQNWNSSLGAPNSWGIPGLVLALSSLEADAQVFIVSGAVLDQYGKSLGVNRANGITGYGIPLGNAYFEDGAACQSFRLGTIKVDSSGSYFFQAVSEEAYQLEDEASDDITDQFNNRRIPPEVITRFVQAWEALPAYRTYSPDGQITHMRFSKPWKIEGEGEEYSVSGLYLATFNRGRLALVLAEVPGFPLKARYIVPPFLNALLRHQRIRGAEKLSFTGSSGSGSSYARALAEGFSLYGIPLSGPLPIERSSMLDGEAENTPELEEFTARFQEAQRFSKGWMIADPIVKLPPVEEEPPEEPEEDS
jgi:hypothetical protein